MSVTNNTADREIRLTRILNAPVELVWEVWTKPEHITNWWGPNGFTNTIIRMDVQPEGEFKLVMHGPDGKDYKNESVFKEVVKYKKLKYEHASTPKFVATIEFEAQGKKTAINWHMLFESKEEFIQVVKTFKADEGLKQNVDKLEVYLNQQLQVMHKQS
nr:SRPBCC family protein [uncultured Lacibacter sp.]